MRRDFKGMGVPLDGCYAAGVENAPLVKDLAQSMWPSPDWVERVKDWSTEGTGRRPAAR